MIGRQYSTHSNLNTGAFLLLNSELYFLSYICPKNQTIRTVHQKTNGMAKAIPSASFLLLISTELERTVRPISSVDVHVPAFKTHTLPA